MTRKRPGIWTYILLTVLLMGIMFPVGGAALAEDKNSNIKAVGQYSDIDPGDINGVYITYLTARGIMSGFPDGGFHPGQGLQVPVHEGGLRGLHTPPYEDAQLLSGPGEVS